METRELILFTKPGCAKCDYVKRKLNLTAQEARNAFGLRLEELDQENFSGLADLAYYELVRVAEKNLPILHTPEGQNIIGVINIIRELTTRKLE